MVANACDDFTKYKAAHLEQGARPHAILLSTKQRTLRRVPAPMPWSRQDARKMPSPGLAVLPVICLVEFRISAPYRAMYCLA